MFQVVHHLSTDADTWRNPIVRRGCTRSSKMKSVEFTKYAKRLGTLTTILREPSVENLLEVALS